MCFRLMIVLSGLALLRMPAAAQTSSFADTWIMFDQVSISGRLYSNAVPKMTTIKWYTDSICFETLEMGENKTDVIEKETVLRSTSLLQKISDETCKKVSATGRDGNHFLTVQTGIYAIADTTKPIYRQTDNYHLEGKQLILLRKAENLRNGEIWECKAIYEKRDEE